MAALTALGIDAYERGDEASARCPNPDHDDTHASWSCNLDSGEHHCFSCGFGGSFMLLVGKMLGKTRGEAELWVRDRKTKDIAAGHIGPRERRVRVAEPMSETDMWKFTEPPARARAERRLTLNACTMYDVRWDAEHELWITPVRDPGTHRLLGWQAKNKRVFRNHPRNIAKSKALFGFELVPDGGTALLVESPLDAPYALPACGDLGVVPVASYGATVSDEQILLLRGRCRRVILAMDNDKAGWESVVRIAGSFGTTRVDVFDYGNSVDGAGFTDVAEPDGRDPGNLSMDDITSGIEQAIPHWRLTIPWLAS